jgi:hypothetical protein
VEVVRRNRRAAVAFWTGVTAQVVYRVRPRETGIAVFCALNVTLPALAPSGTFSTSQLPQEGKAAMDDNGWEESREAVVRGLLVLIMFPRHSLRFFGSFAPP